MYVLIFCTPSVCNVTVRRLSAMLLYAVCLQRYCTPSVCNVTVRRLSAALLILRRVRPDQTRPDHNCTVYRHRSVGAVPLLLSDFNET